jgi:hypothetical protein
MRKPYNRRERQRTDENDSNRWERLIKDEKDRKTDENAI